MHISIIYIDSLSLCRYKYKKRTLQVKPSRVLFQPKLQELFLYFPLQEGNLMNVFDCSIINWIRKGRVLRTIKLLLVFNCLRYKEGKQNLTKIFILPPEI